MTPYQEDDVLYEVRKALRALKRIQVRILAQRAYARRLAKKIKERAELKAIAEVARQCPATTQ